MTRLEPGFYDSNGEFVTADTRVKYRFGARPGTVNAIFQDGEAGSFSMITEISIW